MMERGEKLLKTLITEILSRKKIRKCTYICMERDFLIVFFCKIPLKFRMYSGFPDEKFVADYHGVLLNMKILKHS